MQDENNMPVSKKGKNKRFVRMVGGAALAATLAFGGGSLLHSAATTTYAQTASPTTPDSGSVTVAPSTGQNRFNGGPGRGQKQDGNHQADTNHSRGTISAVSSDTLTITRPDSSTQKNCFEFYHNLHRSSKNYSGWGSQNRNER